jgi:hypothetical protein
MRRKGRTDGNQAEIVKALRAVGASVQPLSAVGSGCPDLLVGYRGANYLLEVKNLNGYAARKSQGFQPDQLKWHGAWFGQVATVFSVEDALRAVGEIQ